jgi:hypothetical protein
MSKQRIKALDSLNKNDYNSKYITLSDNTKIGVDLIKDLIKYFQLEFKNKYRYNYRKWTKIEGILPKEINNYPDAVATPATPAANGADRVATPAPADTDADGADSADGTDVIIYKIIEGEGDDGIAITKLKKYITNIRNEKPDDSDDIEIPEKIFNSDIALRKNYRDSSINDGYIPIIKIGEGESTVYYKPLLEYNYTSYDFQEKSQIYDDLNKINSIFKKSNYSNLDNLVILDFYKDFTKKIEKLKDDIISSDDNVKYDLIDNIYDKLSIIYELKIGRNSKIIKKSMKDIIKDNDTKTPIDICDIAEKEPTNIFYKILCEINKRAQIFNNLTTLKKGGNQKTKGGKGEGINTIADKLLSSVSDDTKGRYQTYLEIDKNILEMLIDDKKFKGHITNLQNSKSLSKLSDLAKKFFQKSPKKINSKIDKKTITFETFDNFIEKIKDRMIEDSYRYLAIIKSLNIIKNKSVGNMSGGQKENAGNIRNQGNQQQGIDDKMSENSGKEYLKNLTEIYINLAKEYGKFINDEDESKKLIKLVIQSQDEKDTNTNGKTDDDYEEERTKNETYFKGKIDLHDKESEKINSNIKKITNHSTTQSQPSGNASMIADIDTINNAKNAYLAKLAALTQIKQDLKIQVGTTTANIQEKRANFDGISKDLLEDETRINSLIKKYRTAYNFGTSELEEEETKKKVNDLQNQNSENEKKSKNLEERKKQLTASLKVIKEELKKLYKACININLPYATEYNDFVKYIIRAGQLKYIIEDNPQINNNNDIIEVYNKEIYRIDKELGDIKIDISSNTKKINDIKDVIGANRKGKVNQQYQPGYDMPRGGGGGTKEDDVEKKRLKALLDGNLYDLIKKDGNTYNLYKLIEELKPLFDSDNDNDTGTNNASGKKYNENETLYEQIWNEYNDGVKAYYNNQKGKSQLTYINEGENLKNKLILYDLDPEIVLKITFQDKVVFLALMFAIRTMIMVLFEFLIDYNIVKSLRYAILIYATLYILILLLFTAFVNLDSYKLRIVFNYLNMHINTPGIILHVMLFIIFSLLVIIIIQTDYFVNNLGDILDYTYIYNYIYTFNFDNILSGEFENNLTREEKIKLQYRLDIISMLIFIFSGTLILLM